MGSNAEPKPTTSPDWSTVSVFTTDYNDADFEAATDYENPRTYTAHVERDTMPERFRVFIDHEAYPDPYIRQYAEIHWGSKRLRVKTGSYSGKSPVDGGGSGLSWVIDCEAVD